MRRELWANIVILLVICGLVGFAMYASAAAPAQTPREAASPAGHIATEDELRLAYEEWELSGHAQTFDNGLGANTTCAKCKSPKNWDPNQELAQFEAQNCEACKRIPGAPRPDLESGIPVSEAEWLHIGCDICHIPAGDSFYTGIAFWNQATNQYEKVDSVMDLCTHCHEGRHGFEVIDEQKGSPVHTNWECTACHGPHGAESACEDCHNISEGYAVEEHNRHSNVNCTACHDAGGLSIWLDADPNSDHFGEYIGRRYAHTLTSWPSHDLQLAVRCQRCHHQTGIYEAIVSQDVSCGACHREGGVFFWCDYFPRNENPNPEIVPEVLH